MIEIIPKPIEKAPILQRILLYFSIGLAVALIIANFLLGSAQKDAEFYYKTLEEQLKRGRTPERVALEKEVLEYKAKIENITPFLEQHIVSSKFFEILENKTHPRIFFFEIKLNAREQIVALSGLVDSFQTLGQQLSILEEEPLIKEAVLTNIILTERGGIEFTLDLFLKSGTLRY